MTYVLREADKNDVEPIQALLTQAHKGITNLPYDTSSTIHKLSHSISSFKKAVTQPNNELYLFSLEEVKTGDIVGLSAIKSTTGSIETPSHFFRRSFEPHLAPDFGIAYSLGMLSYINYPIGPSEMCSLFLDEKTRGKGAGSLLSLGRFLYVANNPYRFTNTLIAELRGIITKEGTSPFYDGVGNYFFKKPFMEMLQIAYRNPRIITELIPKHPLYIDLLPFSVQKALGMTHEETRKAYSILERIGFQPVHEYDIFDGGPKMSADISSLDPIINSREVSIHSIQEYREEIPGHIFSAYVSTKSGFAPFKATRGYVGIVKGHTKSINIDSHISQALNVQVGDEIRVWVTKPKTPIEENVGK